MTEQFRKMVTFQRVAEVKDIEGADLICAYRINGWWVVDQVGKYAIGNMVLYAEIDSWIPHEIAPFLSKGKEPREYNGVKGERLRTVRLKGQYSQGLLLPWSTISHVDNWSDLEEGADVSELLGVQKWEAPIPANLTGQMKGNFPVFIRKTDQERCISGDTLIDTDNGKLTIRHIIDNRLDCKVYSFNHTTNSIELKPVVDWSVMTKRNNWVKITLRSGRELICTNNHRIWCDDILAYRCASDIQIGQKFIVNTEDESVFFINNSINNTIGNENDTMPNMQQKLQH